MKFLKNGKSKTELVPGGGRNTVDVKAGFCTLTFDISRYFIKRYFDLFILKTPTATRCCSSSFGLDNTQI